MFCNPLSCSPLGKLKTLEYITYLQTSSKDLALWAKDFPVFHIKRSMYINTIKLTCLFFWMDAIVFSVDTAHYYCCKDNMHIVMGDLAVG